MFEELKDVFALATGCTAFVNELLKIKNTKNKLQQNDNNGDYAQLASSGYAAQLASSGYSAKLASSGNSAKLASSGDYAQLASSGYSAKLASSGNSAQLESTGEKAVISAIGLNNIAKAKKGSWVTLAEYEQNAEGAWIVSHVKTEYVDGEKIKEDTFYCLYEKEFKEVQIIDNIPTIVYKQRGNIIQGKFLNTKTNCFIFTKDDISAHGKTIKKAYRDWLFKTSDRDVSKYENIELDEIHDLEYWIIAYRTITGACNLGTENYLDNNQNKYKKEMTLKEVLKATKGQYGHNTFKKFFEEIE